MHACSSSPLIGSYQGNRLVIGWDDDDDVLDSDRERERVNWQGDTRYSTACLPLIVDYVGVYGLV